MAGGHKLTYTDKSLNRPSAENKQGLIGRICSLVRLVIYNLNRYLFYPDRIFCYRNHRTSINFRLYFIPYWQLQAEAYAI